ncbi:plasmid recombination protein, partial [Enterococcus faecalis]|uniref:plasmid recombination protein n=2 Tax=Enterococcus TaxID=1350 RepID=UPI0024537B01
TLHGSCAEVRSVYMSFAVARMQKVKSGNLVGVGNHNQRNTDNHSNKDIDVERSHLNYDLVNRTENYKRDIEQFINDNKSSSRAVRKDAVLINEWIITSDNPFFKDKDDKEIDDLSDYYAMTDKAVKKTIFYGRNGKPETKYFGVRDSNRFIRIYNKKQERKDNADVEVMSEHLWRVEIELKRDMVDYWNDCFNDLHILKPDWTSPEKLNEQAMVYMLIHEEGKWGELNKRTKYKYKKIIKEISPIDLTEIMKLTLRENEKQLQKQIDFWHREFRFWE